MFIAQIMWLESRPKKGRSYHNGAVLGAAGYDEVIVRTPVDIQHGTRVSAHRRDHFVDAARLRETREWAFIMKSIGYWSHT